MGMFTSDFFRAFSAGFALAAVVWGAQILPHFV
jgi:hypothetical protein